MCLLNIRCFSICRRATSAEEYLEDSERKVCSPAGSKHTTQAGKACISRGTRMDVDIWSMLDDDPLEKIMSRLPLRSLFRTSSLSKAWQDKFRSQAFQNEVQRSTVSWEWYAPLFMNHKKDMVGYEGRSKRWHRLPTHSYIQEDVVRDWCLRAGDGSLLCWTKFRPVNENGLINRGYRNVGCVRGFVDRVYITNPLTKSCKELPTRPDLCLPGLVRVVCEGREAYKVILGSLKRSLTRRRVCIFLQIFDSADHGWTVESYSRPGKTFKWGGNAVVNGVLCMLVYTQTVPRSEFVLISLDLKERIWKEIPYLYQNEDQKPHQLNFQVYEISFSQVLVCGSNVMQVILHRTRGVDWDRDNNSDGKGNNRRRLSVFRVDLERGLALEVSRAPNKMLRNANICKATGQGDFIYIGGTSLACSSVLYNVGTREWHWISSASNSLLSFSDTPMSEWVCTNVVYQPGLDPFLEV